MPVEQFTQLMQAIETQTQCIQDLSTAITLLQSTVNLMSGVIAGILTGVVFWNVGKGMS